MRIPGLVTLSAVIAIAACSTAPNVSNSSSRNPPTATFITHISADGSKLFVFSLQSPQAGGSGGHGRGSGMHGGRHSSMSSGNQDGNGGKLQQDFNDMLQANMADSGFCRNGFVELDRTMEVASGFISVRGQCKDKATPADRLHFKNVDD